MFGRLWKRYVSDELDGLEAQIRGAFESTPPPDSHGLRGSGEGDEPFLLEAEFRQVPDWRHADVAFIDRAPDGFGSALSFFSHEAFRYYLPGYPALGGAAIGAGRSMRSDPWCSTDV